MMPLVLSAVVAAGLTLQAPLPARGSESSVASELAAAFATVAGDFRAAAEQMPADKYAFRPIHGVRSFGQIVAHVAGGQFLYCAQGMGQRLAPAQLQRLAEVRPFSDVATAATARAFDKQELVALLVDSIEFCTTAYAGTTAAEGKSVRAFIGNIAHGNEHYGNLVTYLRLNGLVPPSTTRAGGQGR